MNIHIVHSLLAHLPVGLALAGPVAIGLALCTRYHRQPFTLAALGVYATLMVVLFPVLISGGLAWVDLSSRAREGVAVLMEKHIVLGWFTCFWTLTTLACLGVSAVRCRFLNGADLAGAMLCGLMTALSMLITAGAGSKMVFDHTIGVTQPPKPASAASNEDTPALTPLLPIDPLLAEQVSFVRDISPLFERGISGFEPHDIAAFVGSGDGWIVPGRPGQSRLVRVLRGEEPPVPTGDGKPMSQEGLHQIRQWIYAGALLSELPE